MTLRDYLDNDHLSYLWNKIKAKFLSLKGGNVVGDTSFGNEAGPIPIKIGLSKDSYSTTNESYQTYALTINESDPSAFPLVYDTSLSASRSYIKYVYFTSASIVHSTSSPASFEYDELENPFDDHLALVDGNGVQVGRAFRAYRTSGSSYQHGYKMMLEIWYAGIVKTLVDSGQVTSTDGIYLQYEAVTCDAEVVENPKMSVKWSGKDTIPVYRFSSTPDVDELPELPCVAVVGSTMYGCYETGSGVYRSLINDGIFYKSSGGTIRGDVSIKASGGTAPPIDIDLSHDSYIAVGNSENTRIVKVGLLNGSAYPAQWTVFQMTSGYEIKSAGSVTLDVQTGDPDPYIYRSNTLSAQTGYREKLANWYDDIPLYDSGGVQVGRLFQMKYGSDESDAVTYCVAELWYAGTIKAFIDNGEVGDGEYLHVQFNVTVCMMQAVGTKKTSIKRSSRDTLPLYKYDLVPNVDAVPEFPCVIMVGDGDMYLGYKDSNGTKQVKRALEDVYLSKSGGTMTGDLNMAGGIIDLRAYHIDRDATLSGDVYGKSVRFLDKDGELTGLVRTRQYNNDAQYLQLAAYNEKSDGTEVSNFIQIIKNKDGTDAYTVGNAKAFREAIDAQQRAMLDSPFASRPTSANLNYGDKKLRYLLASSAMTTAKPPTDAAILHMPWDTSNWETQLAVGSPNGRLFTRGMSNGTWKDWNEYIAVNQPVTGTSVRIKHPTVDITKTNNNISSTTWPGFSVRDVNDNAISGFFAQVKSDGQTGIGMWVYNRNTSGTQIASYGFILETNKSGTIYWTVPGPAAFRSAIGAAASSDRRLKSDIQPLGQDAVEFVDRLEPCVYTINGERQVGLIAQDVHEADPWGTRMAFETQEKIDGLDDWEKMEDGSPTWKLDYVRIIPPLTAALKKALSDIEKLKAEMSELRAIVDGNDLR